MLWLVLLVLRCVSFVVVRPMMLGIMVGMTRRTFCSDTVAAPPSTWTLACARLVLLGFFFCVLCCVPCVCRQGCLRRPWKWPRSSTSTVACSWLLLLVTMQIVLYSIFGRPMFRVSCRLQASQWPRSSSTSAVACSSWFC